MNLNGFLVDVHTTSESNLEVQVDTSKIPWESYRKLIEELEDLLAKIDRELSSRSQLVRERQLKARYQKIAVDSRRKILTFAPFPSKFGNLLKNTRTYIYELVKINCILLEHVGQRKVYLLPKDLAPEMMTLIQNTNEKVIKKLNEDIDLFRKSNEYFSIKICLTKYGVEPGVLDTQDFTIGRFTIAILPVDFTYDVDKDDFYEKFKKEEAQKGLEILKKQLEEKNREYALTAMKETVRRIVEFAQEVESNKRIVYAVKKIDTLIGICNSLKLNLVNKKILRPLKKIFQEEPKKRQAIMEQEFGTWKLKEEIERRLREVALVLEEK
jgi:hypothetical protein